VVNHRTSAAPFERLQRSGIPTHYLETLSHGEMLCHRLDIIKGTLDLDVNCHEIVRGC
jgi:phosphoribosylaminoimidazole-succinocarboxamide synthase